MRKIVLIIALAFALFGGSYGVFTVTTAFACSCGCAMECAGRCGASCDGCTTTEGINKGAQCCREAAEATGPLPACPVNQS